MQLKYSVKQNKSVSEDLLSEMVGFSEILLFTDFFGIYKVCLKSLWPALEIVLPVVGFA